MGGTGGKDEEQMLSSLVTVIFGNLSFPSNEEMLLYLSLGISSLQMWAILLEHLLLPPIEDINHPHLFEGINHLHAFEHE
jgi:hypothetical protein